MTCVSKEYKIKTKIVYEQWLQLKMLFLLVYRLFYWFIAWPVCQESMKLKQK